jgi:putative PIN family toxin of toxin-antitoxin system
MEAGLRAAERTANVEHIMSGPVRVVLDTSVVVAGLRSRHGVSRLWLEAALDRRATVLVSVPLITEYEAVLCRPEHLAAAMLDRNEIGQFLDDLVAIAEQVPLIYRLKPVLRDPADEMVLETAVIAGADALLTFNVADFAPASHFQIPILTPALAWQSLFA